MGCYEETLRFLARLGASTRIRWQSGLSVSMIDRRGHTSTLRLPSAPAPLHLIGGVFAWDALTWAERSSVLRIGDALRAGNRKAGPTETVRQWLVRHGQAPRLCELLWEPLALAALNQSIDHAAAGHFVGVLQKMFGPDPAAASIVLPAVPLDDLYANPAREWLSTRGGDVRLHAPARVRVSGDRVAGVRIRDEQVDVPIVISAVPWFGLASIFDEPPPQLTETMQHADDLESSAIVTVNAWFDRPIVDRLLVGLPGRRFQWVFDKGAIFENGASHLSLVSSGASSWPPSRTRHSSQCALTELREAVPAARTATLRRASAVRERRATFSLAPSAPPRPQTENGAGRVLPGRRLDRHRPAGHDRVGRGVGTSPPLARRTGD